MCVRERKFKGLSQQFLVRRQLPARAKCVPRLYTQPGQSKKKKKFVDSRASERVLDETCIYPIITCVRSSANGDDSVFFKKNFVNLLW